MMMSTVDTHTQERITPSRMANLSRQAFTGRTTKRQADLLLRRGKTDRAASTRRKQGGWTFSEDRPWAVWNIAKELVDSQPELDE
jgi:hypothetical protein